MKKLAKLTNGKRFAIIAKKNNDYLVINQDNKIVKPETSYNVALHFTLGYLGIIKYF